jgi:hypothetical protein
MLNILVTLMETAGKKVATMFIDFKFGSGFTTSYEHPHSHASRLPSGLPWEYR